jgi:putative Mg2+ transporter-C (MgtC) family protein
VRYENEALLRLLVAVALGAAIGAEREASEQPAGLRTHIAVCLGACLFGVVSTLGFVEFQRVRAETNFQVDVTRVASQVVVGIGFLGAGVIFRQGTSVKNVTTAASLWVTSAIGLTAGVGDIGTAAVATVLMLIALVALLPLRNWVRFRIAPDRHDIRVRLVTGHGPGEVIEALHALEAVDIASVRVEKEDGDFVVATEVSARPGARLHDQLRTIAARDDVWSLLEDRG